MSGGFDDWLKTARRGDVFVIAPMDYREDMAAQRQRHDRELTAARAAQESGRVEIFHLIDEESPPIIVSNGALRRWFVMARRR